MDTEQQGAANTTNDTRESASPELPTAAKSGGGIARGLLYSALALMLTAVAVTLASPNTASSIMDSFGIEGERQEAHPTQIDKGSGTKGSGKRLPITADE